MKATSKARTGVRLALSALYALAGTAHLAAPAGFLAITPGWVPDPALVIMVTGICEVAGAFGLLWRPTRRAAGLALAAYAICVYPANIHHALYGLPAHFIQLGLWYHIPRLLFQPVLVWAALFASRWA
ncbi:hypothetical protein [Asaia bogorensis]|uniref:DoxX family protein n=1 Tax=Asaia bogorensis TaxID=91915 RepID=UPI000EFB9A14|nr:hypothetical protein [Asaia bogorensis]